MNNTSESISELKSKSKKISKISKSLIKLKPTNKRNNITNSSIRLGSALNKTKKSKKLNLNEQEQQSSNKIIDNSNTNNMNQHPIEDLVIEEVEETKTDRNLRFEIPNEETKTNYLDISNESLPPSLNLNSTLINNNNNNQSYESHNQTEPRPPPSPRLSGFFTNIPSISRRVNDSFNPINQIGPINRISTQVIQSNPASSLLINPPNSSINNNNNNRNPTFNTGDSLQDSSALLNNQNTNNFIQNFSVLTNPDTPPRSQMGPLSNQRDYFIIARSAMHIPLFAENESPFDSFYDSLLRDDEISIIMTLPPPMLTNTIIRFSNLFESFIEDVFFNRISRNRTQRGLRPEELNNFSTHIYQKADDLTSEQNEKCQRPCVICLSDFDNGDQLRTLTCLHCFHQECIDSWLTQKGCCPICRRNFVSQQFL